jgi:hypothetical protein
MAVVVQKLAYNLIIYSFITMFPAKSHFCKKDKTESKIYKYKSQKMCLELYQADEILWSLMFDSNTIVKRLRKVQFQLKRKKLDETR